MHRLTTAARVAKASDDGCLGGSRGEPWNWRRAWVRVV